MLLFVIFSIIVLFFIFILWIRAWKFQPSNPPSIRAEDLPINGPAAVEHLQRMIRCRTISAPELRDENEFKSFRSLLPECYPTVFASCTAEHIDTTGLLIHWKGHQNDNPAVFLAHYDVVPADESAWKKPPFEGILEHGILWGRGTLDMKNQLCGILEAMEYLISSGFIPKRDIYVALSGEEEIMGSTAKSIRDVFVSRGITPAFVLDEGGDIMDGFFPGTSVTCAMVGIGEKGIANLSFTAKSAGGHASVPMADNPIPRLCRAMDRIRRHSFPQRSGPALEHLVDTMGRYCKFSTRILLANRDILRPFYFRWLRRTGGMIGAASCTTLVLTQICGGNAKNVIPTEASMNANVRLLWGDTTTSVLARLQKIIHDPGVEISVNAVVEPRPDSTMTQGWDILRASILATWPEAVVTPYPMIACTDSRHWRDICPNVFRFSAKQVTSAEKATVHGNNERIRIENTVNAVKFFVRLMRNC